MLLLTVTTETQGRRPTDSCTAIDGELVTFAETTACDQYEPASPWPRSFQGLSSGALSTTAVVRDLPLTAADLRLAVRGYLENHHRTLLEEFADGAADERTEEVITAWTAAITATAATFAAGAVVERWWETLSVRGDGPLRQELPPRRRRASW